MRRLFSPLLFCFLALNSFAQAPKMRLGFSAGPTVAWTSGNNSISPNFFTVSRAGFQGGITNSLDLGEHFYAGISVNYSIQSFGLKQTGTPAVGMDARFRAHNVEVPIMVGTCGYIGSLKHREFLGVGMQFNLSTAQRVKLSGDSSSFITYKTSAVVNTKAYPVFMAGFEVGSIFKNDAAMYFGATFKYSTSNVYDGSLTSNRFPLQSVNFKGTYLGISITYYLPRYSYWFKREFIY